MEDRAGLRPVAPFRTKVQVRQRQKGHAMFDPVCAVRTSRALRPGEGLDGGKEAMVARQRMKARNPKSQIPNPKSQTGFGFRIWDFGFALLGALVLTTGGRAQE